MSFYLLVGGDRTRNFPFHGFTVESICAKRFRENTTASAISLYLVLPYTMRMQQAANAHAQTATECTAEELQKMNKDAIKATAISCVDGISRVATATALSCALITAKVPLADSIVFSWDMYPRLHRKYLGDFFRLLRLPRVLATLVGPEPLANDLPCFQADISPVAAFEDSLKRHCLAFAADCIVDSARVLIQDDVARKFAAKGSVIAQRVVAHATTLFGKALGAATGRAVGGHVGEYYGELVGLFVVPALVVTITAKQPKKKEAAL